MLCTVGLLDVRLVFAVHHLLPLDLQLQKGIYFVVERLDQPVAKTAMRYIRSNNQNKKIKRIQTKKDKNKNR